MPTTKHKLFKLKVEDDGLFTVNLEVEKVLNTFLADSNNVYINHSIAVLNEDVDEYDNVKTKCRFILISIIYRDLASTSLDLDKVSTKVKNVVHKQIESGSHIQKPNILTDFDKDFKEFEK